jgi:hypothetical protein
MPSYYSIELVKSPTGKYYFPENKISDIIRLLPKGKFLKKIEGMYEKTNNAPILKPPKDEDDEEAAAEAKAEEAEAARVAAEEAEAARVAAEEAEAARVAAEEAEAARVAAAEKKKEALTEARKDLNTPSFEGQPRYNLARRYLKDALDVNPGDKDLLDLLKEVNDTEIKADIDNRKGKGFPINDEKNLKALLIKYTKSENPENPEMGLEFRIQIEKIRQTIEETTKQVMNNMEKGDFLVDPYSKPKEAYSRPKRINLLKGKKGDLEKEKQTFLEKRVEDVLSKYQPDLSKETKDAQYKILASIKKIDPLIITEEALWKKGLEAARKNLSTADSAYNGLIKYYGIIPQLIKKYKITLPIKLNFLSDYFKNKRILTMFLNRVKQDIPSPGSVLSSTQRLWQNEPQRKFNVMDYLQAIIKEQDEMWNRATDHEKTIAKTVMGLEASKMKLKAQAMELDRVQTALAGPTLSPAEKKEFEKELDELVAKDGGSGGGSSKTKRKPKKRKKHRRNRGNLKTKKIK